MKWPPGVVKRQSERHFGVDLNITAPILNYVFSCGLLSWRVFWMHQNPKELGSDMLDSSSQAASYPNLPRILLFLLFFKDDAAFTSPAPVPVVMTKLSRAMSDMAWWPWGAVCPSGWVVTTKPGGKASPGANHLPCEWSRAEGMV